MSMIESPQRDTQVEPNSGDDPVVVGSRGARRPGARAGTPFVRWLTRRLATTAAQLVAISMAIFGALHLTPGSPEDVLLGDGPVTPAAREAIRAKYNLDDSLIEQYVAWIRGVLHLDFGQSVQTSEAVTSVIADRLPVTLFLAGYALVLVVAVAVPLGLIAGTRVGSRSDRTITLVTTVGLGAPPFAVGIALLYVFGVALGWFPVYGAGQGFTDMLWHLTLPAVTLALSVVAVITRQTRASTMSTVSQDFMTFARARGLPSRVIASRYLLLNSSLPIVTSIGLVIAYFVTGAVVVEQTFSLPGVGSLAVSAINNRDLPVIQAVCLLTAAAILVTNLVADISYAALDPRVRRQMFS